MTFTTLIFRYIDHAGDPTYHGTRLGTNASPKSWSSHNHHIHLLPDEHLAGELRHHARMWNKIAPLMSLIQPPKLYTKLFY